MKPWLLTTYESYGNYNIDDFETLEELGKFIEKGGSGCGVRAFTIAQTYPFKIATEEETKVAKWLKNPKYGRYY
jgi:hypothetical protein